MYSIDCTLKFRRAERLQEDLLFHGKCLTRENRQAV